MAASGRLIGRRRELDDLVARARTRRIVTVVGPGGVGKTALAHAAAEQLADEFPLGVHTVDLARVTDPATVPGAIAAQLGFDSFDALLTTPVDQPTLLVVDNCEHVLDAAAGALVRVLGVRRQHTIVATSRAPLDVPGESVITLTPLAIPVEGQDPLDNPSVILFLQRCRDGGVDVGAGELADVAALCRRLDGLPLAIEIAAARTRTIPIAEIDARLDETVDVLDRRHFRGHPRHRSVATTIGWSYDLLPPRAARVVDQLGVFVGPFSAGAARAVTADAEGFDDDFDELVHASLVAVDTSGDEPRYRLLDTVRRYVLHRLDERGGITDAYDRFVDHTLARSIELLAGLFEPWRAGLMHDLVAAYDDIAEALRWCIAHDETPRRSYRLCLPLIAIVHQGHAEDITDLMQRLIARFPQHGVGGAQARAVLATGHCVTGDYETAVEVATRTLHDHPGPDASTVGLYRVLGRAYNALGDLEASIGAFREGARIGHELGVTDLAQELVTGAALGDADAGRVQHALAEVTAIIGPARAAGADTTASWASAVRSWILARVDPAAAVVAAQRDVAEATAIDFPLAVAVGLRTKAFAQIRLGDVAGARATIGELLDDLLRRGALSNLRIAVDVAAALAYWRGHPSWGRLAATARALPITTPACGLFELLPIPPVTDAPLARHEVINTVRATLDSVESRRSDDSVGGDERAVARMHRRGDLFDIEFDGRLVSVRTSKGMTYIARLVAAPGRAVHCIELSGVPDGPVALVDVADTRASLDQRIGDVQAGIDDADGRNEYGRSYHLQVELDSLLDRLATAAEPGRTGQGTDAVERSRSAVTHRVRNTVRQLTKVHPILGQHLANAIRTGTYCSYAPERPVTWVVIDAGTSHAN